MKRMRFEFERGEDCLAQINSLLGAISLSSLDIADGDGYLAKATSYKDGRPFEVKYSYGFDGIEFECEQDPNEKMHVYQLDAQAFPKGEIEDSNAYHDRWCAEHPDRVMRVLQEISFDGADAFVVLHHARKR